MRNLFVATTALLALASPAGARDNTPYFGIEGGVLFPRDTNYRVDSVRVQTVPIGSGLLGQTVTTTNTIFGSGFVADYKKGLDLDAIVGYDFGPFRFEGELGYKRTRLRNLRASDTLVAAINTAPISGVTSDSFAFGNRTTILSGMINALVDFPVAPGINVSGGVGGGRASVRTFGDRDTAIALQLIGGVSTAISENLDLGLKYRYFRTGKLRYDSAASFSGTGGSTSVSTFSNEGRFRSHSLLASLIYSFGGVAEYAPPPPPVEVVPPPPPPPPATQTCPDGSVILAMDACPVPPPPPPPPPPEPERG
ncbi:MAG: outer membrane beta-barrel protein [Sphingomicrobium sp.]